MKVGIVGHEEKKFSEFAEAEAKKRIRSILTEGEVEAMVSGGCHLGGIDIWAEEIAVELGIHPIIHLPSSKQWNPGYRARNLKIVRDSDILHNIVVTEYPKGYSGFTFDACYHCGTGTHIKSGGCWTMRQAGKAGKEVRLWLIKQEAEDDSSK